MRYKTALGPSVVGRTGVDSPRAETTGVRTPRAAAARGAARVDSSGGGGTRRAGGGARRLRFLPRLQRRRRPGMAFMEKPPAGKVLLDDTVPLTAAVEASQSLQSHTVRGPAGAGGRGRGRGPGSGRTAQPGAGTGAGQVWFPAARSCSAAARAPRVCLGDPWSGWREPALDTRSKHRRVRFAYRQSFMGL